MKSKGVCVSAYFPFSLHFLYYFYLFIWFWWYSFCLTLNFGNWSWWAWDNYVSIQDERESFSCFSFSWVKSELNQVAQAARLSLASLKCFYFNNHNLPVAFVFVCTARQTVVFFSFNKDWSSNKTKKNVKHSRDRIPCPMVIVIINLTKWKELIFCGPLDKTFRVLLVFLHLISPTKRPQKLFFLFSFLSFLKSTKPNRP